MPLQDTWPVTGLSGASCPQKASRESLDIAAFFAAKLHPETLARKSGILKWHGYMLRFHQPRITTSGAHMVWERLKTGLIYQKTSLTVCPCPLCDHTEAWLLSKQDGKSGQSLHTVLCQGCGLARVDPLPDPQTLSQYYRQDYRRDYKKTYQPRPKHIWRAAKLARERAAFLSGFVRGHERLLDIGSGGGEFIAHMAAKGHEVAGVEPNQGYAEFARERYGVTVHLGTLGEVLASPQVQEMSITKFFDLVTSFHVFEHVVDPLQWLTQARQCLKPGGYFLLEVPNILYDRAAPGNVYFMAHLFHYSPQTLKAMAAKVGLAWVATDQAASPGVVRMVFQHADPLSMSSVPAIQGPLVAVDESHAEQVWQAHCQRTWAGYLCSTHALKRAGQRIRQYAQESMLARQSSKIAIHSLLWVGIFSQFEALYLWL